MVTERLLREYVREVLKEDDGGTYGDLVTFDAGMNPYGVSFGSGDDLYKIFVKPFVDVVDTTLGKTKELSQKTQTLVKVAFQTIASSLVPALRTDYAKIFAKEKEGIEKIKKEYGEVYQTNWDAFRDEDVLCTAFCYNPAAILTYAFAKKAPKKAIKLISALTGGEVDSWLGKVAEKFGTDEEPKTGLNFTGTGPKLGSGKHDAMHGVGMEGVIHEDEDSKKPDIASVLTNPKVIAKVQNSDIAKKMEQAGRALVRNTLEQVFKQASGVLRANSLQDMQQKTGSRLEGIEKLEQVPPEDKQKAEQAILATSKKSMKEFYVRNLEAQVQKAVKLGIDENSPYVQDYKRVIAKINAL